MCLLVYRVPTNFKPFAKPHGNSRSNVKQELYKRKFSESSISQIIADIYGKQVGTTYCEGLVDAKSEEHFYQNLKEKEEQWKNIEEETPGCVTGFYNWFCEHKVQSIITGMLRSVREEAGLGNPPQIFTTNASESLNAMLKRKVNYKKNDLPHFVEYFKQFIDEQERELERAVIGRGKYKFRKEFLYLEIAEDDWFRMSREQRERHLKKVAQTNLCVREETHNESAQLPISPEEFHPGLKIPLSSIQGIWKKAVEIVCDPANISAAPGYGSECRMVISKH